MLIALATSELARTTYTKLSSHLFPLASLVAPVCNRTGYRTYPCRQDISHRTLDMKVVNLTAL